LRIPPRAPAATELWEQHIFDAGGLERFAQAILIEVRVFAGSRKSPHIRQGFDGVLGEQSKELVDGPGRVADGPNGQARFRQHSPPLNFFRLLQFGLGSNALIRRASADKSASTRRSGEQALCRLVR
jgi:hypothetical protein